MEVPSDITDESSMIPEPVIPGEPSCPNNEISNQHGNSG